MSGIFIVTTTLASNEKARELARSIVDARLAACVQIDGPIESHFEWDRQLASENEWRLVAKTLPDLVTRLVAYLAENHPYKVPEILWHEVSGVAIPYLEWVRRTLERDRDA